MAESKTSLVDRISKLGMWAAEVRAAAEELGIESKPVEALDPTPADRQSLAALKTIPKRLLTKLAKPTAALTIAEALSLITAIITAAQKNEPEQGLALLPLSSLLAIAVQKEIAAQFELVQAESAKAELAKHSKPKKTKPTKTLYQLKIRLLDSKPPIWRRIQVMDCMLDKLHEHIQNAMGWTNSHLHQFQIEDVCYGDPELLGDDLFGDSDVEDETTTMLHEILPDDGKKFRFTYEYDFGDGWQHEILFEHSSKPEKGEKYPLCLKGARACPPEDVGGVWGYMSFLDAISNPKHHDHEMYLEWIGPFNPEEFDPEEATKMMPQDYRNGESKMRSRRTSRPTWSSNALARDLIQ